MSPVRNPERPTDGVVSGMHADVRVIHPNESGTAEPDGERRTWRADGPYRFENGRIADCWVLPEDQDAFDAIWSSAS